MKPRTATVVALTYLNQFTGDGHHFLVIASPIVTSHIIGRSPFTPADLSPLAILGTEAIAFSVRADSPIKTARDLAERLKSDSLSIGFANALGNQNHLAVAKVVQRLGGDVKGMRAVSSTLGDATTALLGGTSIFRTPGSAVLPHVAAGTMRTIAVSGDQRIGGALAAVPTWKELGIDAVTTNWRSAVGPRGMTEEQINYWNNAFARLVQLPEWKEDMEKLLVTNLYLNSRDTRRFLEAEYAAYSSFLTEVGLAKKPSQ
jgi:putative tricarboxylic transport membrane protein